MSIIDLTKNPPFFEQRKTSFIVRLPEKMNIPEWYVTSTNRPIHGEPLDISIYEISDPETHVSETLQDIIKYKNDRCVGDTIEIDILDRTGVVLYTMKYYHVTFIDFNFSDFDYNCDEPSMIHLKFKYSNFEYIFNENKEV